MMEKNIQHNQLKKLKTSLNVDRCNLNFISKEKIIKDSLKEKDLNYSYSERLNFEPIYACYHLEKEVKSGLLAMNKLTYDVNLVDNKIHSSEIKLEENTKTSNILNYGILDIKQKEKNIYTSNSDGSISIFDNNNNTDKFNLIDNLIINENNCSNVLDLCKENNNFIAIGMNNGEYAVLDTTTNMIINVSKQIHEYGLWALFFNTESNLFTGADDNTIHLNDLRTNTKVGSYKEHTAGITHINRLLNKEYEYLTGSYDESVTIFDIRNLKQSVYKQKLGVSVWDIKQTLYENNKKEKKTLFSMSSIYEGLNIYEFNTENYNLEMKYEFKEHETIVYGVDVCLYSHTSDSDIRYNKLIVTSCSLYDNLICYWEYDLN